MQPAQPPRSVGPTEFRHVVSRFATGVSVVSVDHAGTWHGMTVNSFASVSLDPVLVLFCCERDASLHDPLLGSGMWSVSVLGVDQEDAARWFATRERRGVDQFSGWRVRPSAVTRAPVLDGCLAWFDCRTWAVYDGGDHVIVVGEVLDLGLMRGDAPALLYFHGLYRALAE